MVNRYDFHHCVDDGDYVLYNDYAALEARVAELEKDAARYRWARIQNNREASAALLTSRMDADKAFDEAMSREA